MVYSFESTAVGDTLLFEATANADMDCDAIQSIFKRFLFVDPATCSAEPLEGLYTEWLSE